MLTSDVFVCMTKKKSLTIQEKVSLLHIYQLNPSNCAYSLIRDGGQDGELYCLNITLKRQ